MQSDTDCQRTKMIIQKKKKAFPQTKFPIIFLPFCTAQTSQKKKKKMWAMCEKTITNHDRLSNSFINQLSTSYTSTIVVET